MFVVSRYIRGGPIPLRNLSLLNQVTHLSSTRQLRSDGDTTSGQTPPISLGADNTIESNIKTATNRLARTGQKFWKNVSLNASSTTGKIQVELDSKPIKTPAGNNLAVDKNRSLLALLLKAEWDSIPNLKVKPYSLPLTSLVSRCIDLENPKVEDRDLETKSKLKSGAGVGADRGEVCGNLLRYLDTDTLLVFSPRAEYEGALRLAQDRIYLPIIKAIERFLSKYVDNSHAKSKAVIKLKTLDADVQGLASNVQSDLVRQAARNYLDTLSYWDLAVFEKTVLTTKSFICGILLVQNKSRTNEYKDLVYTVDDIVEASTLEVIYQTERWGEVEDTHDVNKRDIKRNVSAAAIVAFEP